MTGTCTGIINVVPPACVPNWTGGGWGACQPENAQYRTETDGCGNSRVVSQYCCYPVWGGGTWGPCQSGNVQYKTETDGCGNSRVVSQYCTYTPPPTYAASDGSTPPGTLICFAGAQNGTILSYYGNGYYTVYLTSYGGTTTQILASQLILGHC